MKIDFHAHMQPGSDHGCKNSEMAASQLVLARDAGMTHVVTVSHYYPHKDNTAQYLERRSIAAQKLQAILEKDPTLPKVLFGSEVALCPGLDKMESLKDLCISGTDCILIEMPFTDWSSKLIDTLEAIKYDLELTPVLAHVDRYDANEVEQLLKEGFWGQLNMDAFAPMFGKKKFVKWAENGYIAAIGSDIHGTDTGYKNLGKTYSTLKGELFDSIMARSAHILGLEGNK